MIFKSRPLYANKKNSCIVCFIVLTFPSFHDVTLSRIFPILSLTAPFRNISAVTPDERPRKCLCLLIFLFLFSNFYRKYWCCRRSALFWKNVIFRILSLVKFVQLENWRSEGLGAKGKKSTRTYKSLYSRDRRSFFQFMRHWKHWFIFALIFNFERSKWIIYEEEEWRGWLPWIHSETAIDSVLKLEYDCHEKTLSFNFPSTEFRSLQRNWKCKTDSILHVKAFGDRPSRKRERDREKSEIG